MGVTAPVALLRMHGRNYETWEKKGIAAAERFDYLYSEEELEEWTPRVQRLAEGSREVHVLMNNCHHDYAVRNARQMTDRLGARQPKQAARDTRAQRRLL